MVGGRKLVLRIHHGWDDAGMHPEMVPGQWNEPVWGKAGRITD